MIRRPPNPQRTYPLLPYTPLFRSAYNYNKFKEFTVGPITQRNRNLLLLRDSSVDGIKTGHTSAAGYCLMASAKRGDQRLVAVVMGDTSENQRAVDAQA